MKNTAKCAKNLAALLKKLPEATPPEFPEGDDPVAVLVQSFLLADSTTEKTVAAYGRLREQTVDFNDLRVTMAHEMAGYLGARYPHGIERCQRLRATLRNIYMREHHVSLDHLRSAGKRDVKKYIESLDGMTPYVSARVMLMCFDTHALPVDEQLRAHLVAADAVDEDADAGEISNWLCRQVKASDGLASHLALQAWMDRDGGKTPAGKSRTRAKTTKKKKTTKRVAKTAASKSASSKTTPRGKKTAAKSTRSSKKTARG